MHFSDQQSASGRHHWSGPAHPIFDRRAGPTFHVDVGHVRPHKAGRPADGVHGPPGRESGQVRPHVGRRPESRGASRSPWHAAGSRTCNSGGESYDVRPLRGLIGGAMREGGVMARRGRGEGTVYRRADGRWEAAFGFGGRRQIRYDGHRRLPANGRGRSEGLRRNRSAWELVEDLVGLYVRRCCPSIETKSIVVISPPKIWVGGVCPSRIEARRNPT